MKQISSIDLVVGDILEITPFSIAPCGITIFLHLFFFIHISFRGATLKNEDMAVVSGSCVVDESMLTGESTPVLKSVIPPQVCTILITTCIQLTFIYAVKSTSN